MKSRADTVTCAVPTCDEPATHLEADNIGSQVCEEHAGPNDHAINGARDDER